MTSQEAKTESSERKTGERRAFHAVLLAAMLATATLSSYTLVGLLTAKTGAGRIPTPDVAPVNPFADEDGLQLVVYVIAASDCGWSSTPVMKQLIGSLRDSVSRRLSPEYSTTRAVAVILDEDVTVAWQFLGAVSNGHPQRSFDQVVLGGSWLNETLQRWVWTKGLVEAASPQVFIVARPVSSANYLRSSTLQIGTDSLVARIVGSAEIQRWISTGARVPVR